MSDLDAVLRIARAMGSTGRIAPDCDHVSIRIDWGPIGQVPEDERFWFSFDPIRKREHFERIFMWVRRGERDVFDAFMHATRWNSLAAHDTDFRRTVIHAIAEALP